LTIILSEPIGFSTTVKYYQPIHWSQAKSV